MYIISPLTNQLRTNSRKVTIKYVGPLVIYKIVDPHNYLLMTLDGKILRGLDVDFSYCWLNLEVKL